MRPTTKFAKLGNDRVGYQVLGDGPIDLVFLTGMSSHIDLRWEETLILNRTGYRLVTTDHARYLAEHIPDARLVELPGTDGVLVTEHATEILDTIEEFLSRVPGGSVPDRVLATVLFTDIVNSTDLAASSGDRRWKAVLETHDEITRDRVARFQGRFIESTGDGVLATFDRPGRGIRAAGAIQESIRALGIDIRAGLHAGEI